VVRYREVEPWVWVDPDSRWRLAAKVVDGHVARFSVDQVSPFMVFEPSPWWRSAAWMQPVGISALLACALTALLWPVAAITRRRLKVGTGLGESDERARVRSRIAAVAITLISFAWLGVIIGGLSSLSLLSSSLTPWLYLLYTLSVVIYIGGALVLVQAALAAWSAHRPWSTRLWSTVLAVAGVALLWIACAYHLLSFKTQY